MLNFIRVRGANWDRECGRKDHAIHTSVELKRWVVICPSAFEREMRQFVNRLKEFSRTMEFPVTEPRWQICDGDRSMLNEIDTIAPQNPKLILIGTTTNSKSNADL